MRKWINLFENLSYPEVLDQRGLIDYVESTQSETDLPDEDHILAVLDHPSGAVLKNIPLKNPKFNGGSYDEETADWYHGLDTDPPPIIVSHGQIKDGNHRVKVALRKGLTSLPGYELIFDDDEPL